jgi:hypothetical protein
MKDALTLLQARPILQPVWGCICGGIHAKAVRLEPNRVQGNRRKAF